MSSEADLLEALNNSLQLVYQNGQGQQSQLNTKINWTELQDNRDLTVINSWEPKDK